MDRVIARYDGSPHSATALAWAAEQARLRHAEIHALTVVDRHTRRDRSEDLRAQMLPAIERASHGLAVKHHIEHGDAAAHLVQACATTDLLVVGSRAHGPVTRRLLGSVSRACVHTAACPVVAVRTEPEETHGVILVGVDGSTAARHAPTCAAPLCSRYT
ncbi:MULTISPECIES: universal stress protein [unclassified Amycolatopsis]|uniref:universal stress protein n=1 Tax=unclassified Amycolatopsis TaxID=2618356 RepID=UPI001C69A02B|nr:universal stress protein [Amycolatopsis sp. DSM 110486]QYN20347.1 universal stress protein [Amycolatopsis sp. DSM 110486]